MIEIDRIEKSIKNPRFLAKVFSESEQKLFRDRGMRSESVAANFAAKEAFSKALGCGVRGFSLTEVEVLRDELGAPFLRLSGNAEELGQNLSFSVSLTHTAHYASAVVVAWER